MCRPTKTILFDFLEKPLRFLAIICLIALLVSQILLFKEKSRPYLSGVDRLEGESVALETPAARVNPVTVTEYSAATGPFAWVREHKTMTIRLLRPVKQANIYVLINGENAGDFSQGTVSLTVFEGDYIAIDATRLKEEGSFIIQSDGLESPEDGMFIEGGMKIIGIGSVKFRH